MEQELEVAEERHRIRFLVRFAVLAGLLYLAGRFLAQKRSEYVGLTESEAKQKLVDTIGPKIGEENAEEIADQVIPKLIDRGLLKADPLGDAVENLKDVAKDVGDKVSATAKSAADKTKDTAKDVGDKVSEAVDEVTKD